MNIFIAELDPVADIIACAAVFISIISVLAALMLALKTRAIRSTLLQQMNTPLVITGTNDAILVVKRGEVISDYVRSGREWDAHIMVVASEVAAQRGGTAVDIGAHFGVITTALAQRFSAVKSFEANPFNFKLLRTNVVLNGLTNVQIFNRGIFSKQIVLSLAKLDEQEVPWSLDANGRFDGMASYNLGAYTFSANGSGVCEIPANTLDSYGFDCVSFIKIDIQGADCDAILGALETIKRCKPVIVFEVEELLARNFTSFAVIEPLLTEIGYDISILLRHNEKQCDYIARPKS